MRGWEQRTESIRNGRRYQVFWSEQTQWRRRHRSQNRIESYHQLRSVIAQIGGKKELTGRTGIEIEISNQCARLIANAIIYYNSAILSRLPIRYEENQNAKALDVIQRISPAAWRHVHMNGHYTFRGTGQLIDLDAIVAELNLARRNFRRFGLTAPEADHLST